MIAPFGRKLARDLCGLPRDHRHCREDPATASSLDARGRYNASWRSLPPGLLARRDALSLVASSRRCTTALSRPRAPLTSRSSSITRDPSRRRRSSVRRTVDSSRRPARLRALPHSPTTGPSVDGAELIPGRMSSRTLRACSTGITTVAPRHAEIAGTGAFPLRYAFPFRARGYTMRTQ